MKTQGDTYGGAFPLPLESQISILKFDIQATENLRAFHYATGNLYGARLQAIRIGTKRAQLRRMKRENNNKRGCETA